MAGQETFDRVVLEFAGPAPEYRVEYVEPPILQAGSGRPVELEGDSALHDVEAAVHVGWSARR